jgi:hypothetical protein
VSEEPLLGRFEFLGEWWLDGHDEDKLTGTLTIDRGATELVLVGTFKEQPRDHTTLYRIVGMSTDGDGFTLLDCSAARTTRRMPGIPKTTHRPRYALRGRVLFIDGENVGFDEIYFRTSDLEALATLRSLSFEPRREAVPDSGDVRWTGLDVGYTNPEVITAKVGDGVDVHIAFVAASEGIGSTPLNFTLTQRGQITYHSATRLPIDDAIKVTGRLRNLLTLAAGRPVALLSITGRQKDVVDESTGIREPTDVRRTRPEPGSRDRRARRATDDLHAGRDSTDDLGDHPDVARPPRDAQSCLRPFLHHALHVRSVPRTEVHRVRRRSKATTGTADLGTSTSRSGSATFSTSARTSGIARSTERPSPSSFGASRTRGTTTRTTGQARQAKRPPVATSSS